jgi:hypothetical protein
MQALGAEGASGEATGEDNAFQLNFQLLWKPRQNLATRFGNHDHVFQPDPAESWVIKTRLNSHHLSIF